MKKKTRELLTGCVALFVIMSTTTFVGYKVGFDVAAEKAKLLQKAIGFGCFKHPPLVKP